MKRIVLASKSPRRRELLGKLYRNFEICAMDVDETLPWNVNIKEGTAILAVRKGEAVAGLYDDDCVIVSSDTLVELDGEPLGKPENKEDAFNMLRRLSGRTHNVHTGVAVHYGGRVLSGVATSSVSFREISDAEILDYIVTGEPMDKAGSYGIQGEGGKFVLGYNGDFDTIMGLSLSLTERLITDILGGEND